MGPSSLSLISCPPPRPGLLEVPRVQRPEVQCGFVPHPPAGLGPHRWHLLCQPSLLYFQMLGWAGWAAMDVARVTQMLCDPGRPAAPGLWFLPEPRGQRSGDAVGISPMRGRLGTRAHCAPGGGWTLSHCLLWAGAVPSPSRLFVRLGLPLPHTLGS